MDCIVLILKFFGGLALIFGSGYLIGSLLKLDKHLERLENSRFS